MEGRDEINLRVGTAEIKKVFYRYRIRTTGCKFDTNNIQTVLWNNEELITVSSLPCISEVLLWHQVFDLPSTPQDDLLETHHTCKCRGTS